MNSRKNPPSDQVESLKGRIRSAEQSLHDVQMRNDPVEVFLKLEIISDIIRSIDRLNELNMQNPGQMLLNDSEVALYNMKKQNSQIQLLDYYNLLNNADPVRTTDYLKMNPIIRQQIATVSSTVPPNASSTYQNAVAAFIAAFPTTAPGGPGSRNDRLRENIINIFGKSGENLLRYLTPGNYKMYLPGMHARYQKYYGPVSEQEFANNINDYLMYKGGKKNKRKSRRRMSNKLKNKRRSNKRK